MESCSRLLSLLTYDLLVNILDKLADDDSEDCKSFRTVCKAFHQVESTHRTSLRLLRLEFLPNLLNNYTSVDTLDLSVCPRIDDRNVTALLDGNTSIDLSWTGRLKRLVLSRSVGLRWAGLELLVGSCTRLESLDLSSCVGFGDREAAVVSTVVGLKEVKMDRCFRVSDVGLAKIVVGCENLQKLSLKWCDEISDIGIDFLSKKCVFLKHLDISYIKITGESIQSISTMQRLEVLAMVGCGLVDDVGLHHLRNGCPSLQVIDISRCDNVTSLGLSSVIHGRNNLRQLKAGHYYLELSTIVLNCFKDLNNLQTIRMDGARVSDHILQVIASNCKLLVDIGFSKCKGVTDFGISQLVLGCFKLKILDLTCCDELSNRAIAAIADSCRNLMCLKIESCNLLTEKSFESLGSRSSLLEELDVTDCCGVNDEGLKHISKCSKLKSFKLGHCTNISDKGLSDIASNCSNILELDLYRCKGVGDEGLAALATGCKKLKKLNLSYCIQITDKGMQCVGCLKELSELDMRNLTRVTSAGFSSVASGCIKLAELDMKNCKNITDSGFLALSYHSKNLIQINLSYCRISDVGLYNLMGNLTRLQDAKLLNLSNVTMNGFELALRASCFRLKKVKMLAFVRSHISMETLNLLQARGCKIKWD
ncbi:F-box/LRR-repeat protein 3 [Heracleum sosnowskyi]|uniref:F-box/LRR-repeat protein 3 n=1 Tax=Heracleum sosnowskyi TaxID=360622 RepID=A0AAD8HQ06_9APIA|nr:F-box/LRR-repeat protein 3 [Heracleum sosnowskyi]